MSLVRADLPIGEVTVEYRVVERIPQSFGAYGWSPEEPEYIDILLVKHHGQVIQTTEEEDSCLVMWILSRLAMARIRQGKDER